MTNDKKTKSAAELIREALEKRGVSFGTIHKSEAKVIALGISGNYHTMTNALSQTETDKVIWGVLLANGFQGKPPLSQQFVPRTYWKGFQSITVMVTPRILGALPTLSMTEITVQAEPAKVA